MKNFYRYLTVMVMAVACTPCLKAGMPAKITAFFEQCSLQKDLETVMVNKELLEMANNFDFANMGIKKIIDKIESLGIVTADKKNKIPKLEKLTRETFNSSPVGGSFEVLLSVTEGDEKTRILQSTTTYYSNRIFVIITSDESEMVVVVICGKLTLSDINQLSI